MEVIHTIENAGEKFQFLQDGDRYAVVWDTGTLTRWLPQDAMIGWSLLPTSFDVFKEMDRFILGYFPEGLVTLVALENA